MSWKKLGLKWPIARSFLTVSPGKVGLNFNVENNQDFLYGNGMEPKLKTGGGRPPKFHEPRRPVTMTLPERILDQLAGIDPDRTSAVVKVTEAVVGTRKGRFKPVELVEMSPNKSLIVIGPSKILRKIHWIKLIEITPARYLVSIPSGTPIETLEVALRDLSRDPVLSKIEHENSILHDLLNLIGFHRRSHRLSKEEILVIDTG